ncbi:MAG: cytochrome C oxidase subunit IV family protein [Gemmataceae bacterium]|nr:cytochrome C oxidase subunit IV family protein [Gemmataceae bacterium]
MTDSHDPGHHEPTLNLYFTVFVALSIFTAMSFLVFELVADKLTAMLIILGVAVAKATLVVMYFMHAKYDWGRIYFLIIPVVILAIMMMVVLMPDTVVAWHNVE